MKYKMLVLDIDETLLPSSQVISRANLDAVHDAQGAGVFVTVATGRGFLGSKRVIDELGIKGGVINYSGALITDTVTGGVLHVDEIEPQLVCELLSTARELGVHSHLYQGDAIIYERPHPYADRYKRVLGLEGHEDADAAKKLWKNVPKVLYITEPERIPEMLPMLRERFGSRLEIALSSPGFIEFNAPGSHKGTAVKWLARHMGIDIGDVIAMGDNTLDIDMIKCAGLGVAVANGAEEVKRAADVIAPACEDDAVKWVIGNYILQSEDETE